MPRISRSIILLLAVAVFTAGCVANYTLVPPGTIRVAKSSMTVVPSRGWNRTPAAAGALPREEYWTQNGPLLDTIRFVGGLEAGQAITKQKPKDDRKVPVFRPDMTPQDLASMLESYYRIVSNASTFATTNVTPKPFLGQTGIQIDFDYVTADEVKRRGRAVMAVVNAKLYLVSFNAASMHYYDSLLAEFDTIASSATI